MRQVLLYVAMVLAVALGAAGVVANELRLDNVQTHERLAASEKSAREGWQKYYDLQEQQEEYTNSLESAKAFAKWEAEEACRKGLVK